MIGTQSTPSQLNQQIGGLAVALRSTFETLDNFVQWFNTLALADIETDFSLTAADAQTLQAVVGNLSTLSNVYKGNATSSPPLPFNFKVNSAVLWGGQ